MIRTMAVVGTGLIGTSLALAARRQGVAVHLLDRNDAAARTAAALGAGQHGRPAEPVELAVLAVPPSQVGAVFAEQQARGLALSYTDVASVKSQPEREILAGGGDASCYVGGHPLAGREVSGPLAARADLFRGRPWVLTPSRLTAKAAFDRALSLATLCGAVPVVMRSGTHDEAVALVSHVPHLVASLMAARLRNCPTGASLLAGQGLRDVTRIAGGSSRLWGDILQANAGAVVGILRGLESDLRRLTTALEDLTSPPAGASPAADGGRARGMRTLVDLLDRGIAGLAELPGAAAAGPGYASTVHVALPDRQGELSRLLSLTTELGVGADDATVRGGAGGDDPLVVRFAAPPAVAEQLLAKLAADGWRAWQDTWQEPSPWPGPRRDPPRGAWELPAAGAVRHAPEGLG